MLALQPSCAERQAGRACPASVASSASKHAVDCHRCNTPAAPARRFAALARQLNQAGGGDELIQLVEAGQHALSPEAAAEYLRALADTGRLAEYTRAGPMRCATYF